MIYDWLPESQDQATINKKKVSILSDTCPMPVSTTTKTTKNSGEWQL